VPHTQVALRYNVQRGVAVAPAGSTSADELAGVFSFRLSYEQKVQLDTMACGRRVLAAAPGCAFPAED
jgi:hypothetical protein